MNSDHSNPKKKFRLTALQWSALIILPLFVFALIIKVQKRQEGEKNVDKIVSTKDSQQNNYMMQTASQPMIHDVEDNQNFDSAK